MMNSKLIKNQLNVCKFVVNCDNWVYIGFFTLGHRAAEGVANTTPQHACIAGHRRQQGLGSK